MFPILRLHVAFDHWLAFYVAQGAGTLADGLHLMSFKSLLILRMAYVCYMLHVGLVTHVLACIRASDDAVLHDM